MRLGVFKVRRSRPRVSRRVDEAGPQLSREGFNIGALIVRIGFLRHIILKRKQGTLGTILAIIQAPVVDV